MISDHENRRKVYDAIFHHPLLTRLIQTTSFPYICFLDMQNIFRHCPLKEFHQIHDRYRSNSEALFYHRQQYLVGGDIANVSNISNIMNAVLRYYRNKQAPHDRSSIYSMTEEKRRWNVLWIMVTQKNLKTIHEPIVDVLVKTPSCIIVAVGYDGERKNRKNEMDDYALLLLANQFLDSTTSKKTKKILIFSNDNFIKHELIIKLQHPDSSSKVSFYKHFGP